MEFDFLAAGPMALAARSRLWLVRRFQRTGPTTASQCDINHGGTEMSLLRGVDLRGASGSTVAARLPRTRPAMRQPGVSVVAWSRPCARDTSHYAARRLRRLQIRLFPDMTAGRALEGVDLVRQTRELQPARMWGRALRAGRGEWKVLEQRELAADFDRLLSWKQVSGALRCGVRMS